MVRSERFNNKANAIINSALRMATTDGCAEVNCAYLMAATLDTEDLVDRFEFDTGVDLEAFLGAVHENGLSGMYGRIETVTMDNELSIEHNSKHMYKTIKELIDKAHREGRLINVDDIYDALMSNGDNEVFEILKNVFGVDIDRILYKKNNRSPLTDMPTTAKYASDMCEMAKGKMFDPIESRDDIIDKVIETLGKRQKGNPCLIGEPGVGKTAIIEGLAQRIVDGDVPNFLKSVHIINVDISGIIGGSKYRGDFEERMNGVLYEAAAHKNVILFFDEIHNLTGAGTTSDGTLSAADMLKPAISRGDIKIIGATTLKEYSKFIESDGAFDRRIQAIMVDEPSVESAIKMMKKLSPTYSSFHNCKISDEVIEAAVKLSDRYITNKKLPDKAVSVIDETAARLKSKIIDTAELDKVKSGNTRDSDEPEITLTIDDIRVTISNVTGIDIQDLDENSRHILNALEGNLRSRVIGQDDAIRAVTKAIRRSKSGIKDPNRPIASFLFVGPTGVGKTELTKALAVNFNGTEKSLIRFDMSEFMEKHSVSKLIGAPPGYVGFGDGGQLTEAVKHNPYSVVLFDEIEKAHPDVFNIFLQVLDDGILTDSRGTKVDFKNTIIIMTSNAGYGQTEGNKLGSIGFSSSKTNQISSDNERERKAIKALENTFRPEFLNRLDKVVVFNELTKDDCVKIAELELKKISTRLEDKLVTVMWDRELVEFIAGEGYDKKYGARNIKRKAQETVEDTLADKLIDEEIKPGDNLGISLNKEANTVEIHKTHVLEKSFT